MNGHDRTEEWSRIQAAMRQGQARSETEARQIEQQRQANATPETIRRAKADQIERMLDRGAITVDQRRAANEIMRVWTTMTAALLPRAQSMERAGGGAADAPWPPGLGRAYIERYIPWRAEAGGVLVGVRSTVADLVFMIVVDNYSLHATARHFNMHDGTCRNYLRESLYRYAEIAGWIEQQAAVQPEIRAVEFSH